MLWGKCLNGCIKELNIVHGPVLPRLEELEGNKEYSCDTKPRASTQVEIAAGCEWAAGLGCSSLAANGTWIKNLNKVCRRQVLVLQQK